MLRIRVSKGSNHSPKRLLGSLGVIVGFSVSLCSLSLSLSGCGSAWVRKVDMTPDLPTELSSDMKKRFEVKESGGAPEEAKDGSKGKPQTRGSRKSSGKNSHKNSKTHHSKSSSSNSTPSVARIEIPSRRPLKDPLWVGEKLNFTVGYLGLSAGEFELQVKPYKYINDRKVYHLFAKVSSVGVFRLAYRADDSVESFLDYDGIFSHKFHLELDETKQKRDSLELYDYEKKQTYYWDRWNHRDRGFVETKRTETIHPFSQDMLSILYFLRTRDLPNGAEIDIPLVSEGKEWGAVCTVIRREQIDSPMGSIQAVVVEFDKKIDGVVKKTGANFLWLTDDARKIPVRIEAKVRIGAVVGRLTKVEFGTPPSAETSLQGSAVVSPDKKQSLLQ